MLDIPVNVLRDVKSGYDQVDLAPTLEDYSRLKSEIIKWPLTVNQRFRASEHYRKLMTA
jgi:hypothetical protein